MIYQCYFRPEQARSLLTHDPYAGFGLEPEVNPAITAGCPELRSREHRLALLEHAALLWHWRNPHDPDPWIGFTSYRQWEKGYPFRFQNRDHVTQILEGDDAACWGVLRFGVSLSQQAELAHPGINEFMGRLFQAFGEVIPAAYFTVQEGAYCNYWVMRRPAFEEYLAWFAPEALWCLSQGRLPYARTSSKWLSFVLERLFIVWYLSSGLRVKVLGGMAPPRPAGG